MSKSAWVTFRASTIFALVVGGVGCQADSAPTNGSDEEASTQAYESYPKCVNNRIQGGVTPTKWRAAAEECSAAFPDEPLPELWTYLLTENETMRVRGVLSHTGRSGNLQIYNGNRARGISNIEITLTENNYDQFPITRSYRLEVEIPPLSSRSTEFHLLWESENDYSWGIENVWGFVDYSAVDLEKDIEAREELLDDFLDSESGP